MITKFYKLHNKLRIIAITLAVMFSIFILVRAECHTFDWEPALGIELEHHMDRDRDSRDKEAYERSERKESRGNDEERAERYLSEHMS